MKRPGDQEPAGTWEPPEPPKKPEPEKKPDPKPEPEAAPPDETEDDGKEDAAEAAFEPYLKHSAHPERHREEIAKVLTDVPPELRFRFEQALAEYRGQWSLERGRHLYLRLIREETVETSAGPVVVRERIALRRNRPPRPLPEAQIKQVAEEVLKPPKERNGVRAAVIDRLADWDQVEIIVPDRPPEVIAPETPETVVEAAPAEPGAQSEPVIPDTPEVATLPEAPPIEQGEADIPHESELTEAAPGDDEPIDPMESEILAEIAAVYAEPDPESPGIPTVDLTEPETSDSAGADREPDEATPETVSAEAGGRPVAERPADESTISPQERELGVLLAAVTEALDEANPLPAMGGGSPEWDRLQQHRHDEPPPERPVHPDRPPAPRRVAAPEPAISSTPYAENRLLDWERQHHSPEKRPDARMRRKARKLARLLARRYGIKLTPDTEAMLMEIILAPRLIGGRKMYGLGLNREELIGTIRELALHFPAAAPRIQPPR
jgi:hypothetical protein